ncbi:hypothetical protein HAX54_015747 [Datura stramonium]|uniref:Uncharacterized protein n=1 Tax=Datura stramonium TaxID=4076 RepID=A0ABS8UJY6_DATST|nr:hypothetical protein [Datura stramonium]
MVEECPLAVEEVKMKKRKKPSDAAAVNVQWGVAQDHEIVAESYMLTMNPAVYHPHCSGMQYMSYGHHVLPEESFRRQYVETRKTGFKRNKREMSADSSPLYLIFSGMVLMMCLS